MAPQHSTGDAEAKTPIRGAACLILVDRSGTEPHLLMGRRLATQVFLPNKWVFPGGRVDDDDHALAAAIAPSINSTAGDVRRLPFALAAIRELFEEAGVVLGYGTVTAPARILPPGWHAFANTGYGAAHDALTPLARAITPPGFPRRFDTWFFMADRRQAATARFEPDGELLDLGWFTLAEVRSLDLPLITRLIVDDVATTLDPALMSQHDGQRPLIPFYYQAIEGYQRTLVEA
jgi:8-oxo-dGTP pyrophosphatase MutT (NUDIX family)